MEKLDLKAIQARCDAATLGPWKDGVYGSVFTDNGFKLCNVSPEYNAALIAHARADIPALLAEIGRLRDINKALESDNYNAEMNLEHFQTKWNNQRRIIMESKEERLLKAIFAKDEGKNDEAPDNYPETYAEKVGYAECVVTQILPNISAAIWRLSRLDRMLSVSEKDGANTLPDIITNNEVRMALKPLMQVENDVKDIIEMLTEVYAETKLPKEDKE